MKRLISLLLSLAMTVGVIATLASCDGGEQNPPDDNPPEENVKNYEWTETQNINVKLNLVEGGFINMVKRYMSGEDDRYTANVDDLVDGRNAAAENTTKVHANYSYWEANDPASSWGATDDQMVGDSLVWDESCPDIYVTAAYDCILACVNGALANLVADVHGTNYFSFLENGYDSSKDDLGYNYDLMRTFSPIPDQAIFMLSSDYTTDVFRALHAIPVSITLLEGIDVAEAISDEHKVTNFDYDENGTFDIEELLDFVWRGQWTWDAMASLCSAVYVPSATGAGESFTDTVFGFYIDVHGGSSGNAITYYSPFKHWSKTFDENGIPTYTQYDHTAFQGLADAYERLLDTKGAMRLNMSGISDAGTTQKTPALAIMEKFGNNEVLFMDNTLIGVIEHDFFQNMEGSFGIVPMPLVEAGDENTRYTTAIGNAARVIAFAKLTDDFSACTAYVDYQSTHSEEILNHYFRSQQYEATNGEDYNIRMLKYLRTILVDQEAQFLYLHAGHMPNISIDDLIERDTVLGVNNGPYQVFDEGANLLNNITKCWRNTDDCGSELSGTYYTEAYMNTMTHLYKIVVEKYLEMVDN